MTRQTIECALCLDEIKYGASVCKGCHAEITYGAPTWAIITCFALVCVATYFVLFGLAHAAIWLGILDSSTDVEEIGKGGSALYIMLGMLVFNFIVTMIICGTFLAKIFKNRVRFKRTTIELK